jgi:site-specific DNA-methyltransferase (adenine-specific)
MSQPVPAAAPLWNPDGPNTVALGDNLDVLAGLPDASFRLIYLDPPFNTGRPQARQTLTSVRSAGGAGSVIGFKGRSYERIKGDLLKYDDRFEDYWGFLEPRLIEAWRVLAADGTLYLHLDYREAHYAKVLLDALFGRESFLNEIIWAYDFGGRAKDRWPAKHDTILVYVRTPGAHFFDQDAVDRIPYLAPNLVTAEKAERGKLPTDVWWHTIVPTNGREKTGYPNQKPAGILRRIVSASSRRGDRVLDFFAGSGTTGAVAAELDRRFVLIDDNPAAIEIMRERLPSAQAASVG